MPQQNIESLAAVLTIKSKPPFSFFKNGNTEGVLKSPFFKDTAGIGRYRHVLNFLCPA